MVKLNKTKIKKEILIKKADAVYNSWWIEKFKNKFQKRGKKALIEKAIEKALIEIKKKTNQNPIKYFYKGMTKIKPLLRILNRRKSKLLLDVPTPLRLKAQWYGAIKMIVKATRNRLNKSLDKKLIEELITRPYNIYKKKKIKNLKIKWNENKNKRKRNKEEERKKKIKKKEKKKRETTNYLIKEYKKNIKQLIEARIHNRKRWI